MDLNDLYVSITKLLLLIIITLRNFDQWFVWNPKITCVTMNDDDDEIAGRVGGLK